MTIPATPVATEHSIIIGNAHAVVVGDGGSSLTYGDGRFLDLGAAQ